MSMGKVAMATDWSGNMDFMDDSNSLLVGHQLVGVDPDSSYNFCLNGESGVRSRIAGNGRCRPGRRRGCRCRS
jgi:hypothetical protein